MPLDEALLLGAKERLQPSAIDRIRHLASIWAVGAPPSLTVMSALTTLAGESYCYLTTTGRVSGEPREIEIWFGLEGTTLYMLSGGRDRSDWVRNLMREPRVSVRIADRRFDGRARVVSDANEDVRARELLFDKYAEGYSGDLSDWRERSLPIAVDL
jgi:deazaflavin-dependent oxidoreductase (nitroreductase family)